MVSQLQPATGGLQVWPNRLDLLPAAAFLQVKRKRHCSIDDLHELKDIHESRNDGVLGRRTNMETNLVGTGLLQLHHLGVNDQQPRF